MKALRYFAIAAACALSVACQKTEWDVITPNGGELYGNNNITEDNIVTIAQLKQMYPNVFASTDQNALIDKDVKIKGRVTANDIRGNIYKQFALQDETGAIIIAVNESGMSGYLAEGQEIIMDLKGLHIGGYGKQPEIGAPYNGSSIGRMSRDVFQQHFKFVSSTIQPVEPIDFDVNMNMDENCGKLVTLRNVTFLDANGKNTYAPGDSSVTILGGCVNRALREYKSAKVVIRTSTYAKFAANKLPYDEVNKKAIPVNITGIATRYAKGSSDTWQILIRKENDIEEVKN
jgi:hypothetical protein